MLVLIIGISTYLSHRHTHSPSVTHDKSDLRLVPASRSIPAGGTGNVSILLTNGGPDDLDHNVTFTVTTSDRLVITAPGAVQDNGVDGRFYPAEDCTITAGGRQMRCESYVTVSVGRQVVWNVPVRVEAGTPPGTAETLSVSAVGNSLYTDSNTGNNSHVAYSVVAGRPGGSAPGGPTSPSTSPTAPTSPGAPTSPSTSTSPAAPTSPTARPSTPTVTRSSVPGGTVTAPTRPTSTKSHTPAGTRIRNAARDAVAPVSIVVAIVLGLAVLIVIALAFVARRQRRLPLDYIPPRRGKTK